MATSEMDQYQQDALRTWTGDGEPMLRRLNAMLGLVGESGELADAVKKWAFHGHPLPQAEVVKELGDILWYVAVMAHEFDVSLSEVAERNISKLRVRYPDGFSMVDSMRRSDVPGMAWDRNGKAQHYDRT